MTRILIAGCGYVGSRAGAMLVERGCEVFGLRRSDAPLPRGVQPVRADLARVDTLGSLPGSIDVVLYAAGAGSPSEDAYRAAYVDGPSNLLRALREQGERPARLVFCSSTAVYGQSLGEWVDESSPTRPRRWNGELLLTAESLARASGVPCTILRLGGIYGPGRTRLVERVRKGEVQRRPEPHFTNRIHRDDAAGALVHLALNAPEHELYLGVDDVPSDEADVLCWLADQLGVAPPAMAAPAGADGAGRQDRQDRQSRRAGSKRCKNARLRASGYGFRFPSFREGYAALLRSGSLAERSG